mgnify:CR=1 FL=1
MEALSVIRWSRITSSLQHFLGLSPKETPLKLFEVFSGALNLLKEAKELPPTLYRRVFFVNCTLQKVLIAPELQGYDWNIVSTLIIEIAELKSVLQMEAACVGLLKVLLEERYYFFHEPSIERSRALFGDGVCSIYDLDGKKEEGGGVEVASDESHLFKSFIQTLKETSVCEEPESFDKALLELTQGYKFSKGRIFIEYPESEKVAERYLSSDRPIIKAIAEFFFYLHRSKRHQKENSALTDTCPQIMKYLKEINSVFVLTKKSLVPTLAKLITLRQECAAKGKSFHSEILERSFLDQFIPTLDTESQVLNADTYELLIKIESKWREVFDQKFRKPRFQESLNVDLLKVGRDQLACQMGDGINERLRKNKEPFSFPVRSTFPFCASRAEFLTLCNPQEIFKKANFRETEKAEHSPTMGKPSSGCGAGSGAGASADSSEVTYEKEASHEVGAGPEAAVVFEDIRIASRVQAWQISQEEGIAFYRLARPTGEGLSESEMSLRHRLPLDLVPLIRDSSYSKKGEWCAVRGERHDHFKSLLYIDAKKYILEATFDKENVLYHFYARELRTVSDYSMSLYAPFEFPSLGESREVETSAPITRGTGIRVDEMGNGHIDFDGRHYQLLKLS